MVLAMELAGRLHQLTAAELAPVVKKALRDDPAWPLTWEFDALDWTGNPATVGLFRLAGIARTSGGGEVPWTVGLKVVADVDLTGDPETYKKYVETATPAFQRHKAKFLARGGRTEVLEGKARARNVIIEFPSMEEALACYNSPEYTAARAIRQTVSQGEFVLVEGIE